MRARSAWLIPTKRNLIIYTLMSYREQNAKACEKSLLWNYHACQCTHSIGTGSCLVVFFFFLRCTVKVNLTCFLSVEGAKRHAATGQCGSGEWRSNFTGHNQVSQHSKDGRIHKWTLWSSDDVKRWHQMHQYRHRQKPNWVVSHSYYFGVCLTVKETQTYMHVISHYCNWLCR